MFIFSLCVCACLSVPLFTVQRPETNFVCHYLEAVYRDKISYWRRLANLPRLAGEQVQGTLLFLSLRTGVTSIQGHVQLLHMGSGEGTQVSMFVRQALNQLCWSTLAFIPKDIVLLIIKCWNQPPAHQWKAEERWRIYTMTSYSTAKKNGISLQENR